MIRCDGWVYVSLPHATYALGIEHGLVREAPPIARWAVGRHWGDVESYLRRKRATIRVL